MALIRRIAKPGIALALGARNRGFESLYADVRKVGRKAIASDLKSDDRKGHVGSNPTPSVLHLWRNR